MAVVYSDNFNRANEAIILSPWAEMGAAQQFAVSSNTAVSGSTSVDAYALDDGHSYGNDQYAQVVIGSPGTDGTDVGYGVICRGTTAAVTGYRLIANGSGWHLARYNAGTGTNLKANQTGTTWANGDVLRLEISGANYTVKKALAASPTSFSTVTNGTGTDGSPIASGKAGMAYSGAASSGNIDNFEGGTLTTDTSVAATGSAVTVGVGAQAPGIAVPL